MVGTPFDVVCHAKRVVHANADERRPKQIRPLRDVEVEQARTPEQRDSAMLLAPSQRRDRHWLSRLAPASARTSVGRRLACVACEPVIMRFTTLSPTSYVRCRRLQCGGLQ
jgi:hypothetical protein